MQHVNERALLARDLEKPLRRAQRRLRVAPDVMRGGIARDAQIGAFFQPLFVLGVKGRAAARMRENFGYPRIVGHKQRAGRRAHEDLDPRRARQTLELGNVARILMGAADIKGEVAMHAILGARDLIGEIGRGRRERLGVRHLEHGRHAAQHRGARAGFEIFLMRRARLAEMHLRVDDAGQNMQPRAIDALGCRGAREIADFGDLAMPEPDVAQPLAVMIDQNAAGQNRVEALGHRLAPCLQGGGAARNVRSLSRARRLRRLDGNLRETHVESSAPHSPPRPGKA